MNTSLSPSSEELARRELGAGQLFDIILTLFLVDKALRAYAILPESEKEKLGDFVEGLRDIFEAAEEFEVMKHASLAPLGE